MTENLELLEDELSLYKGQWFVINCNSGHEERVKSDLLQKIETNSLQNLIFDIRISKTPAPSKNGKILEKNKFPGYIFINMEMTDAAWFTVRNTPGVTGFIGSSGKGAKPLPLTNMEVAKMLNPEDEESKKTTTSANGQIKKEKKIHVASFKLKDIVLIKEGPFNGREGQVVEMDPDKGVAIVNIEMFGRHTPTEVSYENAELAYKL
ncbi:transcription antitermination protein NusG [Spiroplasma sabaudiense Ar-1343]|uniref:Transcription termination/antitermination protein NusG n=1 Tax=Spiroplasma sabaudiense Ar-1343 TaxID=1276257 RepID=W6A8V4_9MOLU|nr:transcription termination/antitermination protein NusG [Spiroplasma sabaudiense]AHI53447.1 transcription antitermination protein NusG [Spiroplasma sabaudiense Ar-1343]